MFMGIQKSSRLWKVAGLLLAAGAFRGVNLQMARASDEVAPAFSFSTVRELARALAAKEFHPEQNGELPESMKKLTYDEYQSIRFRPEQSLWNDEKLRFKVQFFSRGYLYQDPVKIHVVDNAQVSDVKYSPAQFDYDTNRVPTNLPSDLQFGGFRLLYPVNSMQKMDEVAEFLGASYFRVLGAHQRYGASIRGLAINTAEPAGEEFPRFTEFWLEKPPPLAGGIRIFALMDSPSVAGAYRFVIQPGGATLVDVEASLFFRKSPRKVGLAPLGSLFLEGQNRTRLIPDYRPQVHDSDGLLIETGDSNWIWRPLVNPAKSHRLSEFPVTDLKGFGLMQRDRSFDDYEDLGSRFELRPSYWVEPTGHWGPGAVELVEIPTPNDWNDNIVAYWMPRDIPPAGQELHLTYRLSALLAGPDQVPLLRVQSTRIRPEIDGAPPRFVIDYAGTPSQPVDLKSPAAVKVHASAGQVRNLVVQTNDGSGGWQIFFDLTGAGDNRSEVRLRLQPGNEPVGETWVYDYQKSN
jgi:periplasmic glucans biosynthesis protein